MFYLVNSVNFIKYLNYFYKLNLKSTLKHKPGERWDKKEDKGASLLRRLVTASRP